MRPLPRWHVSALLVVSSDSCLGPCSNWLRPEVVHCLSKIYDDPKHHGPTKFVQKCLATDTKHHQTFCPSQAMTFLHNVRPWLPNASHVCHVAAWAGSCDPTNWKLSSTAMDWMPQRFAQELRDLVLGILHALFSFQTSKFKL